MRRVLSGILVVLVVGAFLGLAQESRPVPPAEVTALEGAFAQVVGFFREFILEVKGSFTMLEERVKSLERTSLILKLGLEEAAAQTKAGLDELRGRFAKLEGAVVPAIMALEGRVTALEGYDYPSLERRIAALAVAMEALAVRVDNNRAKIEGLEAALAGIRTAVDDLPAVLDEVRAEVTVLREDLDAAKAQCAAEHQRMWAAIFLVPLAVGGLLFLLLSSR
ncbi:MAG: hypothetical protein N2320_03600 [Candidatus Bipolaricaulota bacterium]|nr:hypothetical protein [Candidatus Bipolaricaulota bacterium]